MKHTKGPWKILKNLLNDHIWIGPAEDVSVCEVRNGGTGKEYGGKNTEKANAALIAAAPELLQCLKETVDLLEMSDIRRDEYNKIIAKAEGNA